MSVLKGILKEEVENHMKKLKEYEGVLTNFKKTLTLNFYRSTFI